MSAEVSEERGSAYRRGTAAGALLLLALSGCADSRPGPREDSMALTLTSAAFQPGGSIPPRHTCEGKDVSPPLAWSGVPDGARSLALIVDDPDAPDPRNPRTTWVHWVLYDLPVTATSLPEGAGGGALPPGTRQGLNDWQRASYGGPCPPVGRHRYFHKLYALDTVLPSLESPTKAELERAMLGHVLAQAELMGTYEKGGIRSRLSSLFR